MNKETINTTKLSVPSISCGGCATAIKKTLGAIEGVASVEVDITSKVVTVKYDERTQRARIATTLEQAGFPIH